MCSVTSQPYWSPPQVASCEFNQRLPFLLQSCLAAADLLLNTQNHSLPRTKTCICRLKTCPPAYRWARACSRHSSVWTLSTNACTRTHCNTPEHIHKHLAQLPSPWSRWLWPFCLLWKHVATSTPTPGCLFYSFPCNTSSLQFSIVPPSPHDKRTVLTQGCRSHYVLEPGQYPMEGTWGNTDVHSWASSIYSNREKEEFVMS